MNWKETTDVDMPHKNTATFLYEGMVESQAGQIEGVFRDSEDKPITGMVVAHQPENPDVAVAVYIDFKSGEVITAWKE